METNLRTQNICNVSDHSLTLDGLISYNRSIFPCKSGFTTLSEINTGSIFFYVKLRDVSNNLQTYFPVCNFVVCLPWSFFK